MEGGRASEMAGGREIGRAGETDRHTDRCSNRDKGRGELANITVVAFADIILDTLSMVTTTARPGAPRLNHNIERLYVIIQQLRHPFSLLRIQHGARSDQNRIQGLE